MSSPWPEDYYTPVAEMDTNHILKSMLTGPIFFKKIFFLKKNARALHVHCTCSSAVNSLH